MPQERYKSELQTAGLIRAGPKTQPQSVLFYNYFKFVHSCLLSRVTCSFIVLTIVFTFQSI